MVDGICGCGGSQTKFVNPPPSPNPRIASINHQKLLVSVVAAAVAAAEKREEGQTAPWVIIMQF